MDLNPVPRDGAVILTPAGRIDHASADAFQAALQPHLDRCRPGAAPIVLDMHDLEYISSVGLRVLMMAARQVKDQNGHIAVARLSPLVKEVFEISRFDLVFDTFDSVDAALAAARSGG
ncbi:MAG: anti-sigma factor antagonist [Betaproteobacteria bacterium]|nr:MAG: anti-sigma factor antagonist [Betaproteobacteria bacterium]